MVYLHNGEYQHEQVTTGCNHMNESFKNNVEQKKPDTKRVSHLYKIQYQAKLIYASQPNGYPCGGRRKWQEEGIRQDSEMLEMFGFVFLLVCLIITQVC